MTATTAKVTGRLRTLAILELVNIAIIGWFVFGVVGAPASPANVTGFALTVPHLVVSAAYWAAKLVQIRRGWARPPGIARFDTVRRVLVGLLVVGLVVIVTVAVTAPPATWLAGAPGAISGVATRVHSNATIRTFSHQIHCLREET